MTPDSTLQTCVSPEPGMQGCPVPSADDLLLMLLFSRQLRVIFLPPPYTATCIRWQSSLCHRHLPFRESLQFSFSDGIFVSAFRPLTASASLGT